MSNVGKKWHQIKCKVKNVILILSINLEGTVCYHITFLYVQYSIHTSIITLKFRL